MKVRGHSWQPPILHGVELFKMVIAFVTALFWFIIEFQIAAARFQFQSFFQIPVVNFDFDCLLFSSLLRTRFENESNSDVFLFLIVFFKHRVDTLEFLLLRRGQFYDDSTTAIINTNPSNLFNTLTHSHTHRYIIIIQ